MAMGSLARQLGRVYAGASVAGLTEGQLLDRFVHSQDPAAFEALVTRHGPMVRTVCRRLLADPNDVEDAFQATFLVLVRKAGTLRNRDLLGNWLYGVAYKVASRARAASFGRGSDEGLADQADSRSEPDPTDPAILEEVARLPGIYQSPVILCYFEGLTHEEAADRLGWPVGTVKGRLARARERLRTRLARRGFGPGVVAPAIERFTTLPMPGTVPALAERLVTTTVKAATLAARGEALAGLLSARAITLTQGVIQAMTFSKFKTLAASAVLAGTLTTGAGTLAYQAAGEKGPGTAAAKKAEAPKSAGTAEPKKAVGVGADSAAILERLQNKVDVSFGKPTPLEDVLKFVKVVSTGPNDAGIAIYVDPVGLQETENTLTSTVTVEGKHITLEEVLNRALRQLDLDFVVKNGLLTITARASVDRPNPPVSKPVAGTPAPATSANRAPENPPAPGVGMPGGIMGGRTPPAGEGGGMSGMAPLAPLGGFGPPGAGGGFMGGGLAPQQGDLANNERMQITRKMAQLARADSSEATRRLLSRLEDPVTLKFPNETPLEDVLKFIKTATEGPNAKGVPIYVDPVGLQQVEQTLTSPVTFDLEGVPLKTSLRLILKQLDLAYCVRDGVLIISSVDGVAQELDEALSEAESAAPPAAGLTPAGGSAPAPPARPDRR